MDMSNWQNLPPQNEETALDYARRLEAMGHEEMLIRKALCDHFSMDMSVFAAFFDDLETARLRHISMIRDLEPNRTDYSMVKKIAKNLGLSDEQANMWFIRFQEIGRLPYID